MMSRCYFSRLGALWLAGTVVFAGAGASVHAQALSPGSSVLMVPTVPRAQDGVLHVGYARIPESLVEPSLACAWYPVDPYCDELLYFATLQFLPRLQVSLRYTLHDTYAPQETGDRSLGAVFRVLDEKGLRPSVAIGVRDAAGTRKAHATFVVARKEVARGAWSAAGTLGGAFKLLDASHRELENGLFGGVDLAFQRRVHVLAEYDTRHINAGARLVPVRWAWAQVVWMDLGDVAYSAGLSLALAR